MLTEEVSLLTLFIETIKPQVEPRELNSKERLSLKKLYYDAMKQNMQIVQLLCLSGTSIYSPEYRKETQLLSKLSTLMTECNQMRETLDVCDVESKEVLEMLKIVLTVNLKVEVHQYMWVGDFNERKNLFSTEEDIQIRWEILFKSTQGLFFLV